MFPSSLEKKQLKRGESSSEIVEGIVECMAWHGKIKSHYFFINSVYNPAEILKSSARIRMDPRQLFLVRLHEKYNHFMGGVDLVDAKRKIDSCVISAHIYAKK